jgi:apolipoprotein N-acyltransferase
LTVGFELGFGHYVAGHPWSDLVADYDLASGRLWVLIPAWTALAPYLLYRLRR